MTEVVPNRFWPKVLRSAAAKFFAIAGALPAAGHLGHEAPGTALERRLAPEVSLVGQFGLDLRGLGGLARQSDAGATELPAVVKP